MVDRRRPQTWRERFIAALDADPSPGLESWRWAREGEEPCDELAVNAAWDLVTQHASAEANLLNHALRLLHSEMQRTLFAALVVSGARVTEIGALEVVAPDGRRWRPRDLSFVPGREPLPATMRIRCHQEIGRNQIDFMVWYQHEEYLNAESEPVPVRAERELAIVIESGPPSKAEARAERAKDLELATEGYLVVRFGRSDIWRSPMTCAAEALRTLVESTRFDCEALVAAHPGT